MQTTADVLIVGAGPVGLLLANELIRDGVDVCIVEKMAQRSYFCKALGVTARTLEIFDDLGIAQQAIDAGIWLTSMATYKDGVHVETTPVHADGLPYGALSLAQYETERLLEASLERHGGRVHYAATLLDYTESAEGVTAQLQHANGQQAQLQCKWLVGCDGAHSTVRRALGFEFDGGQYPQTFVLADLDVDWPLPRGPMYRLIASAGERPGNALAAVPIRGSARRYRLSTMVLDDEGRARLGGVDAPDLPSIEAVMQPLLPPGTRLSSLRWSSVYRVSHRIVPRYGAGRVFIAGDAAHLHPPVGGQGMNTGLQDVHNLAWKLVLATRGRASATLVDSYSAERHPVGVDVVQNTSAAMNNVIAQQRAVPGMRETQLLISYRGSPVVDDDMDAASIAEEAPAPGDRAPDALGLRQPFVGHPLRLHERLGRGRHVLVGYVTDTREWEAFAALVDDLRIALGDAAAGLAVLPAGDAPVSLETVASVVDAEESFRQAYSPTHGLCWLVRPDGHVGWRGLADARDALASHLRKIASAVADGR
jgi:2-polyprenyl-6-methoxyphenol hydroxylase-like FAD-dependent oxidoreductase